MFFFSWSSNGTQIAPFEGPGHYSQRIRFNPSFGSRDRVPPSFDIQCAAVALKMRLRSRKYIHLFTLSLLCVFATLVKVHQFAHILKLESTSTPTGSALKAVCQPSPSLSRCFLVLCFMRLLMLNFMR